jgi:uncharacterized surface protein with fasciclin (FAS1) repeats
MNVMTDASLSAEINQSMKRKSVFEVIESDEKFSILLELLNCNAVGRALRHEENNFTFFAPTDGAFYKLLRQGAKGLTNCDEKILAAPIIGQHLVPGIALYSGDLRAKDSVTTLERTIIRIRHDAHRIFLNDAQIVSPGIGASNGVIFAIDRILLTEEQKAAFARL